MRFLKRDSSIARSPSSSSPEPQPSTDSPGVVKVRCAWPANVVVISTVSGVVYRFHPDEVLLVAAVDVPQLLGMQHVGGGCCGSESKPMSKFLVEA